MAWPKESRYLGKASPRLDGPAKVSGRAKYTTDVAPAGLLFGAILRSRWPAAHIKAVNLEKAKAAPGIRAAIPVHPGAFDVFFYGQEIAAIAGESKEAVLAALALIVVDATPKPFVVHESTAAKSDSARVVADQPNLGPYGVKETGNVDAAFAASAAVAETRVSTEVEIHHPMEPHCTAAQWDGDELTVWCSTQGIFGVRDELARALGIPQNQVRVICEHMGGGFGAKFDAGAEGVLAAKLAKAANAPVRIVLTRFEQALAVGNRPSSFQKLKLGLDAEGKVTGFELEAYGTPGYSSGVSSAGGSGGAGFPAPYIYKPIATRVKQGSVAVNAGQSRPMRAPGHPQASIGMEAALDDVAAKLGLDPVDVRLKNDPYEIRRREYQLGAERFGWKEKFRQPGTSPGPVKVGVGCAGAAWMSGGRGTQSEFQLNSDGTLEVRVGTQDLGTGSRTVVQVVAAEMLGIDRSLVSVKVGDTRFPPSGASGGSTTTASVSPSIYDGCENLIAELKKASGLEDVRGDNWKKACSSLGNTGLQVRGKWREGLSTGGAGGVQFAEVEVDTETGFVKVRKMLVVQDCGTVVNKLTCESQINGGVIMGLGYALYEQRVMDARTGVVLNPNLELYKLPSAADIPEIEIMLLDMPERGVIGVGEPCTVPTAAAIANAVANALGVRVGNLPMTPDKVLAALGKAPAKGQAMLHREMDETFALAGQLPTVPLGEFQGRCHA